MKVTAYPKVVDLQNCEDEPIHVLPQIQSHGFLLVVDKSHKIIQFSENSLLALEIEEEKLLNEDLSTILEKEQYVFFKEWATKPVSQYSFKVSIKEKHFLCIPHKKDNQYILDFELYDNQQSVNVLQQDLLRFFSNLSNTLTLQNLCDQTAVHIKSITGYDRVMIYQFDKEWNGLVVSEAKQENQTSFKGLKYPASDIPKQARALFLEQGVRIISDVYDNYHRLIPPINTETRSLTNVGNSHLRGSSPIHLEYLKNMKVAASMSCAIVHEGKLWGLISCHHNTKKFVDYRNRQSCAILANMFSAQIGQKLSSNYIERLNKASEIRAVITKNISKNWDIIEGLTAHQINAASLFSCSGFAVLHNDEIVTLGNTPPKKEILDILEKLHLANKFNKDYFVTQCLSKEIALPNKEDEKKYSGMFVCKLSNAIHEALVWFRPEQISEINWGGDPHSKALDRLSPRKSFEKWTEKVRNTSVAWTDYEISNGRALNSDIKNVIITKFGELELLNKKLSNLNQELESFSYSVSHDLRGPLRGIDGFAQILLEDYGDVLDEEGKESLHVIINSADKMNVLMDEILNYSSINQHEIIYNQIDVYKLCQEIIKDFRLQSIYPNTELVIKPDISPIHGDKTMTYQLFANLVTNAYKYSSLHPTPKIEIGSYVQNKSVVYTVSDNGIGFDQKYAQKIFGVFTRLETDKYEGTGVGLAIAQRVVIKHNGNIWVTSKKGEGTTFYFQYE
ncbi:GAF domain-containing protein [Polaribacter sp. WD7]|uniref:ATP-binding protein n=1 Tax=Polaribacter sp. WD7 TaxID=2269061 RepID=UPI000DF277C6|nr:ATP-binding protein [Polaribacter sp. WD7]RCS27760.1 GAF domain-containing protein [Polaribacter sp. WD7]